MADLPDDRRGGGVFGYLDPSRELRVGDEHKSELTLALRAHLQSVGMARSATATH